AEDGIRDLIVTGVQTCALPIWVGVRQEARLFRHELADLSQVADGRRVTHAAQELAVLREDGFGSVTEGEERFLRAQPLARAGERSEERRVGKECRSRGWPCRGK